METKGRLWLILVFACCCIWSGASAHDRPIIGIVAQETSSSYGDTMIASTYVNWLMSAGARVVAVRVSEPDSYYQDLFSKINGVLFPGGSKSTMTSEYALAARAMWRLAAQAHQRGDYFPVWGICLGFQTIVNIVADANKNSQVPGVYDINLPLNFTTDGATSRLVENMPTDLLTAFKTEPMGYHTHRWGIRTDKFESVPRLKEFFTLVATNVDSNGVPFASMIEAKNRSVPVYGTQFHPEKASYYWNPAKNVDHSPNSIAAGQYFANYFVNEARKNSHTFASAQEEGQALIQNERRQYFSGTFGETFYMDYNTADSIVVG